ncbi:NAD-dependent epimerase/dehydratase family protein [Micromonospora sp. M51]|uniref:NAD-dependent epimerase/dehydratase family protein n=1 Tax=Micromonospora TaxID=1873 RepID=UPI0009DF43F1|nr:MULTISPECIES: NAD-dependent epimerase/dehydratase family protein [Micromonospora]MBQ1010602.1 NAD-dependent epimerase/dehydratase family protein [Micromonospora sp. M51]MBQ1030407.1 NAD-dependent epimerase/dehydratase family protein [Micromonospora sp. C97]
MTSAQEPPDDEITAELERYSRVAVTGGSGFVGRHLVSALAARHGDVVALDVAPPPVPHPRRTQTRHVDLRDAQAVEAAVADADLVIHLAGNASGTVSVERPRFDFETNAVATFNLCEALTKSGVARLVYLSSAMVYGVPQVTPVPETHPVAPFLPYASSKLAGEHAVIGFCHAFGLEATIGRAFTLYGPGEKPQIAGGEVSQFLRWHLRGLPIHAAGDPDRKTRDFCHVEDLVQGLLLLAVRGRSGEVYNIGSGTETSLRELAHVIETVTGEPARLVSDGTVTEDTYRMVADITKLGKLGYRPRIPLLDGVRNLADALGDRPELPGVDTIFRAEQRLAASSGRA